METEFGPKLEEGMSREGHYICQSLSYSFMELGIISSHSKILRLVRRHNDYIPPFPL